MVTLTEKFEKIVDDLHKIRHIIYEKFLHQKLDESKNWRISSDLFSIKIALQNFPSQNSPEIS